MALDTDGGSFARTGVAVLAAVTELFGSVDAAGACAMVRAKEPNKQQNSKAWVKLREWTQMAPNRR
jgi:hypothetical protein